MARTGSASDLAQCLQVTRARTLGLMDAWAAALPSLKVPDIPTLNPPLWEWGHVAWFQDWWVGRNPQRALGPRSDPQSPRLPSRLAQADALYNSSQVAHARRWQLPLPDLQATRQYLAAVQQDALALLRELPHEDDALYFWRLVLLHEDMHNEASVYMAQALGLSLPPALAWRAGMAPTACPERTAGPTELAVPAQRWWLGSGSAQSSSESDVASDGAAGFAFDNEWVGHPVALAAFHIDAAAVTWARYLPFVEATGHALPTHIRQQQGQWQQCEFGHWKVLDLQAAAVHLSCADAQAWCDWAGRRLPTEAQWECAAATQDGFEWGEVWEWTASRLQAYPGFVAHPYVDYSAPWFGTHQVLRGACAATSGHMVHGRYRNFFTPGRQDIFSGFRSVR
ncbi:MAG: SUMF1/EgtB/PvdO family nonheme iron enzyme [Gammaproteobacteria bacterium]|uniref:selenoneine synthase SenA n=1 Tax=Rhodoferax sp. TaxID=50421 RepID=UPI00180FA2A1|nr:selenoneine synthase SenA [Rhodoferax sp.]MBU3898447.1 SUMF1/EgtB/PvdO family nonheme iron enzyme [Gammaproteobacteria bacterium]MBA3059321.1 SUMF1/EgtB/PvdOfamily nonheme iron enzyme [Rhodoferax sp.]MBU3998563.1 SUMF1/EgtB/PvdO family nonheme iron enzyme [Gammaproteobacteria bacterium]MBU4079221.1 SUMF1/EgtB/PvdO family nonheme iron enzyme [Gammaproteobacteria bacterium]MBU4114829.1 SUMF1/EgtB/PvdO family nonheme iron enzyme [Gammaproteobacteria bacterium]